MEHHDKDCTWIAAQLISSTFGAKRALKFVDDKKQNVYKNVMFVHQVWTLIL